MTEQLSNICDSNEKENPNKPGKSFGLGFFLYFQFIW